MGSAESSLSENNLLSNGDMPAWVLTIFEFSNWKTRNNMMITSKRWWRNCNEESFYRFLAKRLAIENGVYVPPVLPSNETWKTLFYDLYKLRNIWQSNYNDNQLHTNHNANGNKKERFKINVYARFCPGKENKKNISEEDHENNNEIEVTLPLYQRLEMIKMSRNIKSNKQALRILAKEGGWFKDKWNHIGNNKKHENHEKTENHENNEENNKENKLEKKELLNHRETKGGAVFDADQNIPTLALKIHEQSNHNTTTNTTTNVSTTGTTTNSNTTNPNRMIASIQTIDTQSNRVVTIAPEVGLREFYFNSVLNVKSTQQTVYNHTARRLVMDFLNGFNATAIVYGQTGSGKTYSMFGAHATSTPPSSTSTSTLPMESSYISLKDLEGRGIVPRACEEIFQAIKQRSSSGNSIIHAEVKVSYVEVFGDEVSDLLKYGARCGQSKVAAQQYVLSGAAERVVTSMEDIREILEIGERQKRRAATHMNERSTRAHSLFIISLKQTLYNTTTTTADTGSTSNNITIKSRLFLADLGGSEQVKKSGVEAGFLREGGTQDFSVGFEMGEHMREAVNINLGLLALKKCIEALNNQALYTPYQDSKLTQLLSAGLGGNSKTSIIICANIDPTHITETVATLRFGEKCSYIEISVKNNISMLESILQDIDNEIKRLETIITSKERWELENIERKDLLAEENTIEQAIGGVEIKKVYMLVGAEKERKELEQLLIKRSKFIGCDDILESEDSDYEERDLISNTTTTGTKKTKKTSKKIVGFGRQYAELYGIGGGFDESMELNNNNTRFQQSITDTTVVPKSVLLSKGNKNWATGASIQESDTTVLEQKAQKVKRNRLAYSGISA